MIPTCHPYAPSPPEREPVAALGNWLFVPDRRNAVGDVRTGYLVCNGERVVLRHTSRLLADLMRKIRHLEREFAARIGHPAGGGAPGRPDSLPGDRAGGVRCTTR
ncbi:hypothetical protein AB0D08_30750 [Kitasatospora sp. NPDC048540]|uniref:hypothetical protein n=1 Tax=Kitasatospora sp. NPDC048540 TaxID=3155634 RepID=UPI0033C87A7B